MYAFNCKEAIFTTEAILLPRSAGEPYVFKMKDAIMSLKLARDTGVGSRYPLRLTLTYPFELSVYTSFAVSYETVTNYGSQALTKPAEVERLPSPTDKPVPRDAAPVAESRRAKKARAKRAKAEQTEVGESGGSGHDGWGDQPSPTTPPSSGNDHSAAQTQEDKSSCDAPQEAVTTDVGSSSLDAAAEGATTGDVPVSGLGQCPHLLAKLSAIGVEHVRILGTSETVVMFVTIVSDDNTATKVLKWYLTTDVESSGSYTLRYTKARTSTNLHTLPLSPSAFFSDTLPESVVTTVFIASKTQSDPVSHAERVLADIRVVARMVVKCIILGLSTR